jgi:hypothetical protein
LGGSTLRPEPSATWNDDCHTNELLDGVQTHGTLRYMVEDGVIEGVSLLDRVAEGVTLFVVVIELEGVPETLVDAVKDIMDSDGDADEVCDDELVAVTDGLLEKDCDGLSDGSRITIVGIVTAKADADMPKD